MDSLLRRILIFIVVAVLVLILPWWLSVPVLIFFTIYIPLYFEVIFFGFMFDVLYSASLKFPLAGLSAATVFLLVVYFVRTQIRN